MFTLYDSPVHRYNSIQNHDYTKHVRYNPLDIQKKDPLQNPTEAQSASQTPGRSFKSHSPFLLPPPLPLPPTPIHSPYSHSLFTLLPPSVSSPCPSFQARSPSIHPNARPLGLARSRHAARQTPDGGPPAPPRAPNSPSDSLQRRLHPRHALGLIRPSLPPGRLPLRPCQPGTCARPPRPPNPPVCPRLPDRPRPLSGH